MKTIITITSAILIYTNTYAQKHFKINSSFGTESVNINGNIYTIDSTFTKIKTRYPKFDTLVFMNDGEANGRRVICNFMPDSSYSFIGACCGSTDIVPSWKAEYDSLKYWDFEYDFEKIQGLLMDHPLFTLKVTNASAKDSIYGWYVDHSCVPTFMLLDENGRNYGEAIKCFYWNNISPFIFFQSTENYKSYMDTEGLVLDIYPAFEQIKILGEINVRLFDNKKYILHYDLTKKVVTLEYDF